MQMACGPHVFTWFQQNFMFLNHGFTWHILATLTCSYASSLNSLQGDTSSNRYRYRCLLSSSIGLWKPTGIWLAMKYERVPLILPLAVGSVKIETAALANNSKSKHQWLLKIKNSPQENDPHSMVQTNTLEWQVPPHHRLYKIRLFIKRTSWNYKYNCTYMHNYNYNTLISERRL